MREILRPLAGRIFRHRGLGDGGLVLHWAEIVGTELSGCCAPVKIVFPRGTTEQNTNKAGVLHLLVETGAATLVQHHQNNIVSKANAYFGYRAVERIALAQGTVPSASRKPPTKAQTIRDEAVLETAASAHENDGTNKNRLNSALARLGSGIAAKERQKLE